MSPESRQWILSSAASVSSLPHLLMKQQCTSSFKKSAAGKGTPNEKLTGCVKIQNQGSQLQNPRPCSLDYSWSKMKNRIETKKLSRIYHTYDTTILHFDTTSYPKFLSFLYMLCTFQFRNRSGETPESLTKRFNLQSLMMA